VQLVLLLAMLGTPVAVSTFTMAQQLEGDADLAGQFVVVSTAVSLFTLFAWISALMALGFI
jgi:predicted permease